MILPTVTVEKPWGRDVLPAPFASEEGKRIGEVWFVPPPALPDLLVKYIFTSEKLSVQVHPSDNQAVAAGHGQQGKEECWLVIDAQPGAALGVGFRQEIAAEAIRAAALDGSIEELLAWHPVQPGDFLYIPAGTVHAIGAGVGIIEIQQNCDITYRLYDYGRPRELHLDEGLAVARGGPHDARLRRKLPPTGAVTLVNGPHFVLDRVEGPLSENTALAARHSGSVLAIPLDSPVHVGDICVSPGQCALAPDLAAVRLAPGGQCLLASPCR